MNPHDKETESNQTKDGQEESKVALSERERFLARILDCSLNGIYVYDLEKQTNIYINRQYTELLGHTLESINALGEKEFLDLFHPDDLDAIFKHMAMVQDAGDGDVVEIEYRFRAADGNWKWCLSRDTPFQRDENKKVIQFLGTFLDITERKRLETQSRQSQKLEAIGQLAGGIAHDFNNILTGILGYCQLALDSLRENEPIAKDLRAIKKAGESASSLTRQLLAFSRKQVMEPRVLDFNTILPSIDQMLRRLIGEDIELVTSLGLDLGHVKVDPGQIEQVIMNLVINARDAMPGGGKLSIETANAELDDEYARRHMGVKPGSYVMLAVSDTGTGMDEETQSRIFDPFFTTKEKGKGTGLGLSTVYGIVKQSGGNIWVYSERGKGTTFKVYFPRVDEDVEKDLPVPDFAKLPRGDETILVAEDEEMVRELVCRILKKSGYTVLEASNGGEALLLCEKYDSEIDLLITDVVMPKMSGKELAGRLKTVRPQIKVLYTSGYTDNAIVNHGVLDADTAFIQKPFTVDGILLRVRAELDKPQG